jgi:hypothetical protein
MLFAATPEQLRIAELSRKLVAAIVMAHETAPWFNATFPSLLPFKWRGWL